MVSSHCSLSVCLSACLSILILLLHLYNVALILRARRARSTRAREAKKQKATRGFDGVFEHALGETRWLNGRQTYPVSTARVPRSASLLVEKHRTAGQPRNPARRRRVEKKQATRKAFCSWTAR